LATEPPNAPLLILDFRRVPDIDGGGCALLGETHISPAMPESPRSSRVSTSLLRCGGRYTRRPPIPNGCGVFTLLDEAIEWAEIR